MNFKFNKELLGLLEDSYSKGEPATIFHVFLKDREVGKLAVFGYSSIQTGDISSAMRDRLLDYFGKERNGLSYKRVTELSLDHDKSTYRIAIETLEPSVSLYVFGAGHVGQAVAMVGAIIGYKVVVVDDRKEFLTRDRFPDTNIDLVQESYTGIDQKVKIARNSAVVIVTRGHQYDEICLKQVLAINARYVGMIGSRRRVIAIFGRLVSEGIEERLLEKVHAPIGIKIGAVSPQEIAIAIMAEIISVMNNSNQCADEKRRLLQ